MIMLFNMHGFIIGDMEKLYGKWDYFTSFINDGISGKKSLLF